MLGMGDLLCHFWPERIEAFSGGSLFAAGGPLDQAATNSLRIIPCFQ